MKVLFCILISSLSIVGKSQQTLTSEFFIKSDRFFMDFVKEGSVDYESIAGQKDRISDLIEIVGVLEIDNLALNEQKAFYINAYNLLVIYQVINYFPIPSVLEIPGFFTRNRFLIAKKSMTLDHLEKEVLIKKFGDQRIHFVLVCGAVDCPKLWDGALWPERIEEQLEERTKTALENPSFLRWDNGKLGLSEIFKWNKEEFGSRESLFQFINKYLDKAISHEIKTYYYDYNWSLNDYKFVDIPDYKDKNNQYRYVVSSAIPKGGYELKVFNNLYTQKDGNGGMLLNRSTYFTTSVSFLYGISNRLNLGFASRYRRVRNTALPSSAFDVFKPTDGIQSRDGITAFGPQLRWAPVKRWKNFSIQSSFTFPIGNQLSGTNNLPFLDWSGPVFLTQFSNDHSIGDKFALFTEIDLLIEEIGGSGRSNRVSLPVTGIFSWFPKKNFTIYGLAQYSPYFVNPYDYFTQFGIGLKYQFTPNFELEFLVNNFTNSYLNRVDGEAATYNLGFRFSR